MMNGLLLLDKSLGVSSNQAIQKVKRLFGIKKIGHTGNLDPLASGMLPICIGDATKFAQYLLDADKVYEVEGCFGIQTTTADTEGKVVIQESVDAFSQPQMLSMIESFQGTSEQIPPMFSALKHKGQPLYHYALKGIDIPRQARSIHLSSIELISYQHPFFTIRVQSSKGTYMRTLVEDIAQKLSTVAHVTKLRRLSTAGFHQEDMVTMNDLESMEKSEQLNKILPMDVMVMQFPELHLTEEQAIKLKHGQVVNYDGLISQQIYRLYQDDFIGLGQYVIEKGLIVKRLCQHQS
jgi:tRNA pseudouridine55 synthase